METFIRNALPRKFYRRDTSKVARELLGRALVKLDKSKMVGGIIIETEAYYGKDDPASHAHSGITARSRIMFGRPGVAYIYLCYGMYYLLNVVTEKEEVPGAVLIRGLKPVWGVNTMRKRRNISRDINPASGPGNLTVSLGINIEDNGADIVSGENGLYIFDYKKERDDIKVAVTRRVGINKGKNRMLRFLLENK